MKPVLSICVPTFNRAKFLKVMLEALLPQVEGAAGDVEVCVSDNASDDDTAVIAKKCVGSSSFFRYSCNSSNIGIIRNIVRVTTDMATGEYVWVLGDHNLLRHDALRQVLKALNARSALDVFYVNFRCATYPDHWPDAARDGYDGSYSYLGNADTNDRNIAHWNELIRGGHSAFCTQSYAHIVRRSVWLDFWHERNIGAPFKSALTTYPHTCMIAEKLWDEPSFYIGDPMLTIFNGAQAWGTPKTRTRVYLCGFPGILKVFQGKGWEQPELATARMWAKQRLCETLDARFACPDEHQVTVFLQSLLAALSFPFLLPVVWNSFIRSDCCVLTRFLARNVDRIDRLMIYLFRDCRPARWIRRSRL